MSQSRLMDELGLTSGTISVRIARLVEEGLVDSQPDPESKRNTIITLTERGRELFERVFPAHLANERRLLSALSKEEEQLLVSLLRKLLVEFEGSQTPQDGPPRLGLSLAPAHVAVTMRESVGLAPVAALLVRAVEDSGPAAKAGVPRRRPSGAQPRSRAPLGHGPLRRSRRCRRDAPPPSHPPPRHC